MIENFNIETFETENNNDEMVFLTPMDIAKAMDCSVPTARSLFYRDDFPGLKIGKNYKVLKLKKDKCNIYIIWMDYIISWIMIHMIKSHLMKNN